MEDLIYTGEMFLPFEIIIVQLILKHSNILQLSKRQKKKKRALTETEL